MNSIDLSITVERFVRRLGARAEAKALLGKHKEAEHLRSLKADVLKEAFGDFTFQQK